ncbi:phospholipase effector Tle1 domain-containing protein [Marinobacter sp. LV10MA510-1]|uniref:phospholipase effector Tle1 domain-containing protein n=1 Tax=Marinobacter sp. LV10MA510-1 TaxID=1415567 RepID=UPI000C01BA44|nr:DUF2235 domain-containing protein [Marinobacter sp. LV10MA510-1]PFG11628.1 putative alpha/beta hydrolase family protein DUF2235 [Marinobacter sp. LV10MA510-1]
MSNLIVACVGDTHVCPVRGHGSSPIIANGATPEEIDASKRHAEGQSDFRPKVTVEAGMFFDGTGNSRDNSGAFERKVDEGLTAQAARATSEEACSAEISQLMEGSYLNAETNVLKLHTLYQPFSTDTLTVENHRIRVYASGVGTKSGKEDDAWAMGTGMGERGILAKIRSGCDDVASRIDRATSEPIDELIFDVFGFSRGAAAARHFVNEVWDGADGALGITGALEAYMEREGDYLKQHGLQLDRW